MNCGPGGAASVRFKSAKAARPASLGQGPFDIARTTGKKGGPAARRERRLDLNSTRFVVEEEMAPPPATPPKSQFERAGCPGQSICVLLDGVTINKVGTREFPRSILGRIGLKTSG